MEKNPKQLPEPGQPEEDPTKLAETTGELSDEQLDSVAGGFGAIKFEYKPGSE